MIIYEPINFNRFSEENLTIIMKDGISHNCYYDVPFYRIPVAAIPVAMDWRIGKRLMLTNFALYPFDDPKSKLVKYHFVEYSPRNAPIIADHYKTRKFHDANL